MSERRWRLCTRTPSHRSRVRLGSAMVLLLGTLVGMRFAGGERINCAVAVHRQTPGVAAGICQREFAETGAPATGIRLAETLRKSGRLPDAWALSLGLLGTSHQADAWQILGNIARAEHHLDAAIPFLELARTQHTRLAKRVEVACDSQALSTVLGAQARYSEALLALDTCITESHAAAAPGVEYTCHLAAEGLLLKVGLLDLAAHELELAAALAQAMPDPSSQFQTALAYMRGNLAQAAGRSGLRPSHEYQAIEEFKRGLVLNQAAQLPQQGVSLELNLAGSLALVGDLDEASRHLAAARTADLEREFAAEIIQIEAEIAYHRGALAHAFTLNEGIFDRATGDDRIDIAAMQARIALRDGDLALAETWAARGVEAVERIRVEQHVLELRPGVLSSRRTPYELRFLALARAGRLEDALLAFDDWQGRTMLDALVTPRTAGGLPAAAREIGTWLSVASQAAFARKADLAAVRATLQTIDLLALVVADGEVWCVTARHGELRAHVLGTLDALRDRFDRFITAPTERGLATELGALILQDDLARPTRAALRVIIDGPLAALPVPALRIAAPLGELALAAGDDSRPVIALRPVLRVPRLPERMCESIPRPRHAIVLADANDDLPRARNEAAALGTQLGLNSTTSLGTSATSGELFATPVGDLLHVATHADIATTSGVLKLHDRDVSALEIAASTLRPSLVVLSACASARATRDDVELSGSLAAAFLAVGTPQVIATLRAVTDTGAAELGTRFYDAGGLSDPVRALAAAQTALAETGDTDWPQFSVFGQERCLLRIQEN